MGGLRGALRSGLGKDFNRQLEVQSELAKLGVCGDVQRELYMRRDITPELVRKISTSVGKDNSVDDPAAVVVHRLRNHNNRT